MRWAITASNEMIAKTTDNLQPKSINRKIKTLIEGLSEGDHVFEVVL